MTQTDGLRDLYAISADRLVMLENEPMVDGWEI